MRTRALIPAIMAFVILLGGPFGFGRVSVDPRAGLICYCCSDLGENCTMISCAGCCGAHAGVAADHRSPEMILEASPMITLAPVEHGAGEVSYPPAAVYLDVPDQPPERA